MNIDEYIAVFSNDVQEILETVRSTIRATTPEAAESVSCRMPGFTYKGTLQLFAASKNHIGLYRAADATAEFKNELKAYERAKSKIGFPYSEPIPIDLSTKIVKFRLAENLNKAEGR